MVFQREYRRKAGTRLKNAYIYGFSFRGATSGRFNLLYMYSGEFLPPTYDLIWFAGGLEGPVSLTNVIPPTPEEGTANSTGELCP